MTSYPGGRGTPGVDEVVNEGIELEASYAMSSGFYIDANANIVNGEAKLTDGTIADWENTPANSLYLTVGQKFGDELDVSWELVANDAITRNDEGFASFRSHNLRATYIPQSGVLEGTELRASVENVFDADYISSLSTRRAPGRNFIFSIAKTF